VHDSFACRQWPRAIFFDEIEQRDNNLKRQKATKQQSEAALPGEPRQRSEDDRVSKIAESVK
jgi:hypothetical protein